MRKLLLLIGVLVLVATACGGADDAATDVIAVRGFVVARRDEVRLCDALAESFPPQCGGDSVLLDGLDAIDPDELTTAGDVSWTDAQQTVLGELVDGLLNTTSLSM